MKFDLFVDKECSIWIRDEVSVEAETLDEAVRKCKEGDFRIDSRKPIWGSMRQKSPVDSPTVEVYSRDRNEALYSNL